MKPDKYINCGNLIVYFIAVRFYIDYRFHMPSYYKTLSPFIMRVS